MRDIANRISNMLGRGRLLAADYTGKIPRLQIRLLHGEIKQDVEWLEQYGFYSNAKKGAEIFAAFLDGDRSHGVVIKVADRRFRLAGMQDGDVALADDLGHVVHLTREGIVINGNGNPLTMTNLEKLRVESSIEATGDIKDNCDSSGKTMANMRAKYNAHNNHVGGTVPNQLM